ncbi:cytochrome d ubiquinol oxidase subunit II [Superficieibacter sp. HKU1]|uniref:cytochrome d ubiquinol oxidase subunit II n=1 Tax=Superficieibacter sp. HKU1 TaxID=3031919 RepID=UPI0023E180A7|nr:cytochrome d ubiquinol oxidase subunit II [Superficieibacter sp. HKU1]WES67430.1 cytochrome d ubiquinol oxidase subunit II [Superficieibacter sp. HKU1]
MMSAELLSASLLAFTLLMYVALDGTDLGTGMLFALFHDDDDRRRMAASILPLWDANETWLVLFAAGLIALFPAVYAVIFSALYLPVFIMVLALLVRAVALEYRSHASASMRRRLDRVHIIASTLAAFTQGAMAGCLLDPNARATTFTWLHPIPLLGGCLFIGGYCLAGCLWLRWRLGGRAGNQCITLFWIGLPLWLLMIAGLYCLLPENISDRVTALFIQLLNASAPAQSQRFVLWGSAFVIPMVVLYHSLVFWMFRGKVK